jgi:hypothetical protein
MINKLFLKLKQVFNKKSDNKQHIWIHKWRFIDASNFNKNITKSDIIFLKHPNEMYVDNHEDFIEFVEVKRK